MLGTVGTVVVFVADLAAARRFYVDRLGLRVRRDLGGWVELATRGATLALHDGVAPRPAGAPPVAAHPWVQVSFEVESVGRVVACLAGEGVQCTRPPAELAPGRWVAGFADPDGNDLTVAGGA